MPKLILRCNYLKNAPPSHLANSLNYILEHGMEELAEENLKELLTFANAAASLITTRKGALRVMPTREEIKNFIQNV